MKRAISILAPVVSTTVLVVVAIWVGMRAVGPPQEPLPKLILAVNDVMSIRVEPLRLDLGEVEVGTCGRGIVHITNQTDLPITLRDVAGCCSGLRDVNHTIAPRETFDLPVELEAGTIIGRRRTKSMTLNFGDGLDPIVVEVTSVGIAPNGN